VHTLQDVAASETGRLLRVLLLRLSSLPADPDGRFVLSGRALNHPSITNTDDIQQQRSYLLRYAMLQLRNPHLAEDVVQETLLAALEGGDKFSGQSSLRTWLVGILKHKILDLLRKRAKEPELALPDDGDLSELADVLFASDGHWATPPQDWADPERSLENARFWEIYEECNQRMPPKTARAFMMREFMDMSTEEICQELAISATNCWVLLHRARLSLRECLDTRWFRGER
jgi:RNA polymerase sigma-70 factor (ECF subfamily)